MLVDVPVSDVELALLRTDAPARIVIEGDPKVRAGKVYFTRGAAATIGADDLAALAKGRHAGVGQVSGAARAVSRRHRGLSDRCPAYVDFPEHRHSRHAARQVAVLSNLDGRAIRKSLPGNWRKSARSGSRSSPTSGCSRWPCRSDLLGGSLTIKAEAIRFVLRMSIEMSPTR